MQLVEKIKGNPTLFFLGILRSYQGYFTAKYGLFSFLGMVNDRRNLGSQFLLAMTVTGLAIALVRRKERKYGLILAAFLGIFLSFSLIPPRDADFMRIHAATIPFLAYTASMGIILFEQPLKKIGLADNISTDGWNNSNLLLPFSLLLLSICFVGPMLIKISLHPQQTSATALCSPGEQQTGIRIMEPPMQSSSPRIKSSGNELED